MQRDRVLHVLGQRPGFTGSGTFLKALCQAGHLAGMPQAAVVGVPLSESQQDQRELPCASYAVEFSTPELPFDVAGMSDVMPYSSTKFSLFDDRMTERYLSEFSRVLSTAVEQFSPDVLWTHHLWLVSALCRDLFPQIPQISFCHGSEILQCRSTPTLATYVVDRVAQIDVVLALSETQKRLIVETYQLPAERIQVIGGAINTEVFKLPPAGERRSDVIEIAYVGKLSTDKGVPHLIEAFELAEAQSDVPIRLTIIGGGVSLESERIRARVRQCQNIELVESTTQHELAKLLGRNRILVLPSFYEGLGLVALEALACGCRLITTELPSLMSVLPNAALTKGIVATVPLPPADSASQRQVQRLPEFVNDLSLAILDQVSRAQTDNEETQIAARNLVSDFTWQSLWQRVAAISRQLTQTP